MTDVDRTLAVSGRSGTAVVEEAAVGPDRFRIMTTALVGGRGALQVAVDTGHRGTDARLRQMAHLLAERIAFAHEGGKVLRRLGLPLTRCLECGETGPIESRAFFAVAWEEAHVCVAVRIDSEERLLDLAG